MAVGRRWLNYHLVGGGPTCLCLSPSPSARLKQATDGVRRFLLQSRRCFFGLFRALFRRVGGTWVEGPAPRPPPPPGSTAYRAGSPLACFCNNLSAAPTWTRVELRDEARQRADPNTASQGRTDSFEFFRPCQLTFQ